MINGFDGHFSLDNLLDFDTMMEHPWEYHQPAAGHAEPLVRPSSPTTDLILGSAAILSSLPIEPRDFSDLEREALMRLGSEVVFSIGGTKDPTWSTHAVVLARGLGNPVVLRFVLAASLTELGHRQPSSSSTLNLVSAKLHYSKGVAMFSSLVSGVAISDNLLVMICFWFWYLRHWRDSCLDRLTYRAMIRRVCHYFRQHDIFRILLPSASASGIVETERDAPSAAPASVVTCLARLTAWLFWADAAACVWGHGGDFARMLFRASRIELSGLYARSKAALACHFAGDYPYSQAVDDDDNELALDLLHQTWVVVQEINEALVLSSRPPSDEQLDFLGRRVDSLLHGRHAAVIEMAESSTPRRNRQLGNADWAVANLYALCIFLWRCAVCPETGMPANPLEPAVDAIARDTSRLVRLMDRSLDGCAAGQIDRLQWPLFWVGVQTDDGVHRKWVFEKLLSPALTATLSAVVDEQIRSGVRAGVGRIRDISRELCDDGVLGMEF